jgi:hypothetical protein
VHEHVTIAVRDHPAALRLFLVPNEWPDTQRERIKELRLQHDRIFRAVVEEGVASGEFTVVDIDTTLQCMHAAMSQAPLWTTDLTDRARDRAVDALADTLMMLVGQAPPAPAGAPRRQPRP